MSELSAFIRQAWTDHAIDAAGVALRLPHAIDLVGDEQGLNDLAQLAHHVYGEHLAAWADGLKFLAALARLGAFDVHGSSGQAMRRLRASLGLAAGESDVRVTLGTSDRIRVAAMAASALAAHDTARALQLFQEALAEAQRADVGADDPMNRTLAVTGNNLACTLEEKPVRSDEEVDLMLLAARTGRLYWERAGTWLEVERAEYRLAMSHLAAGDAQQARVHAQACLDIVDAQADPPALERYFGCEALGLAARTAGDAAGHAAALAQAREAYAALGSDDQGWCRASLDKLAG